MMHQKFLGVLLIVLLIFSVVSFYSENDPQLNVSATPFFKLDESQINQQMYYFTENKGQWDPEILFMGNTSFGQIAFTKNSVFYKIIAKKSIGDGKLRFIKSIRENTQKYYHEMIQSSPINLEQSHIVGLSFVESSTSTPQGEEVLDRYNNYFIGNDPANWATQCNNYTKITYESIWDGIDLSYFFTPQGLKYEFYVQPGYSTNQIKLFFEGADLSVFRDNISIHTPIGTIQDKGFTVYTLESRINLDASILLENNYISFSCFPDQSNEVIVIDPLLYSSFLGGSMIENIGWKSLAIDKTGHAYICGHTTSVDFPLSPGSYLDGYQGGASDAFVVKIDTNSSKIVYSTFLGGSEGDFATSVAVDENYNLYVCGSTQSLNFPIVQNSFQTSFKGGAIDAFVTKYNSDGTRLLYSTYLGGSLGDSAFSICVDKLGNAYIGGMTASGNFPTTSGGNQMKYVGGESDCFIVKLNPSGSSLSFSTYLGGSGEDYLCGIAIDESLSSYICGYTNSKNLPCSSGAYKTSFQGGQLDAFVSKLNTNGSSLIYSTYLGGSSNDSGHNIAVDSAGYAYIFGDTKSTDFPTTRDSFQDRYQGGEYDLYLTKINLNGSALVYSTFIGGSSSDYAWGMCIDEKGYTYISGITESFNFPVSKDAYQNSYKGGESDAFVCKVDPTGKKLLYSSFFGGTNLDAANSIALDFNNQVYISGNTLSSDLPISNNAFQKKHQGFIDAYIAKFKMNLFPPEIKVQPTEIDFGNVKKGESKSLEVVITNKGEETLTGKINTSSKALLCSSDLFRLNGNATHKIIITLDSSFLPATGEWKEFLYFISNDPETPKLTLIVKANIFAGPKVKLNKYILDFGKARQNQKNQSNLVITNVGDELLSCHLETSSDLLSLSTTSFTLSHNNSITLAIELDLLGINTTGHWRGEIIIKTNDPDNSKLSVPVVVYILRPPRIKLNTDEIDFGSVSKKSLIEKVFTISNEGEELLEGQLEVSDTCITLSQSIFSLAPSKTSIVKVLINLSKVNNDGNWKGSIKFSSNDPANNTLTMDLKAYILSDPRISLSHDSIDFGRISLKNISKVTLIVGNNGEDTLIGKVASFSPGISIEQSSFNLSKEEELSIEIALSPLLIKSAGSWVGSLVITSNDDSRREIVVEMQAYILTPPKVSYEKSTISFGSIKKKERKQIIFPIYNTGEEVLDIKISPEITTDSWLSFQNSSFKVLPKSRYDVVFVAEATPDTSIDHHMEKVNFSTNDSALKTFCIQVDAYYGLTIKLNIGSKTCSINDTNKVLDAAPLIHQGRTMVPLRFIGEAFGAEINWIAHPTNEAQIRYQDKLLHLWIGKKDVIIEYPENPNKAPDKVSIDAPPIISNGRTMVPIRFIAEQFDAKVDWNNAKQQITIKWNK